MFKYVYESGTSLQRQEECDVIVFSLLGDQRGRKSIMSLLNENRNTNLITLSYYCFIECRRARSTHGSSVATQKTRNFRSKTNTEVDRCQQLAGVFGARGGVKSGCEDV